MSKIIPLSLSAFVIAGMAVGGAFAAGSHKGGHGHGDEGNMEFGAPGDLAEVTRTIEVALVDTYFEPEKIQVKAGETIRFVLKNEGELVHEFNIATPEMHAAHQAEMEMMVEHGVLEADKINHEMMKMEMSDGTTMEHDDPNSKLLEPGEEAEIVWKFSEPMELEFACNVPGHYDAGMVGILQVGEKVADKN